MIRLFSAATMCLMALACPVRAQYSVLYSFPQTGLATRGPIVSGSTLYVTTNAKLFKINTDGTGYSALHVFPTGDHDGLDANGSVFESGSTLYGMTVIGSAPYSYGTIYQINETGGGYQILHGFDGGTGGAHPFGSVIQSGSTLYGMTPDGPANSTGVVFKVNTDGSDFRVLHPFKGGSSDGLSPYGSLVQSGSVFYGMTWAGGANGLGTVFKMNVDGSGFSVLHSFNSSDGANPEDSLILSGSTLYGMTYRGGDKDLGTVFRINVDGNNFATLHSFTATGPDGAYPFDSLTQWNSVLYGTTQSGGLGHVGTVFQLNTDGTGFNVLHSFGAFDDGQHPKGGLARSGFTLYGTTESTVFKVSFSPGDANLDGKVDFSDLLTVARHYGQLGGWLDGDFNGDGKVDFEDLVILARNYGAVPTNDQLALIAPVFRIDVERAFAEIPEPSSGLSLLSISAMVMSRRRRLHAGSRIVRVVR